MLDQFNFKGKKLVVLLSVATFTLYVLYAAFLLFFSPYRQMAHEMGARYNLVPLRTIINYLRASDHLDFRIWFTNLAGNIAAFVPLGFFVPLLFKGFTVFWQTTLLVFTTTVSVECLQLYTHVGSFDVDDILLNTVGGMIGYLLYNIVFHFIKKREK